MNILNKCISQSTNIIKEKAHDIPFAELQALKESHSKVSDNVYKDFKNMQQYFLNKNISNRQI